MQAPKRNSTLNKHKAVYKYFCDLFEKKRIRYDDCVQKTANHFFYSAYTVEDILRKVRNLENVTSLS